MIEGMETPVPNTFQQPGSTLMLLGGLMPNAGDQLERRFGSTHYAKTVIGQTWGLPPALDLHFEKQVQELTRRLVKERVVESVHDLSDGGLAVAAAECCLGSKRVGAQLDIDGEGPAVYTLFHEAPSRVIVAVRPEQVDAVRSLADKAGVPAPVVGKTVEGRLEIRVADRALFSTSIQKLFDSWDGALERLLGGS